MGVDRNKVESILQNEKIDNPLEFIVAHFVWLIYSNLSLSPNSYQLSTWYIYLDVK